MKRTKKHKAIQFYTIPRLLDDRWLKAVQEAVLVPTFKIKPPKRKLEHGFNGLRLKLKEQVNYYLFLEAIGAPIELTINE